MLRKCLPLLMPMLLAQAAEPPSAPVPAGETRGAISITESPAALSIHIDGKPFTTYRFAPTSDDPQFRRPYFYPVLAADGTELTADQTRERLANPRADHPHHRSIWVGHGNINGVDHWLVTPAHQRHIRFSRRADNAFTEELSWDGPGPDGEKNPVLTETRTVRVVAYADGTRGLDITSTFAAPAADAVFRCKPLNVTGVEAGLVSARLPVAIATAPADKVQITAGGGPSPARSEAEARSRANAWCDYTGPLGDKTFGITLVLAPNTPATAIPATSRGPADVSTPGLAPFHVRTFGFLAHIGPLEWTLKKSESATFRHLLLFHAGNAAQAGIAEKAEAWRRER